MSTNKEKVIITVKNNTDKSVFIRELINDGYEFHEDRLAKNLCEFFLNEEERDQLISDQRVKGIDIKKKKKVLSSAVREGVFTMVNYASTGVKTDPADPAYQFNPEVVKEYKQWGLMSCAKKSSEPNLVGNPAVSNFIFNNKTGYSLDGSNVDVVIFDDGVAKWHQEFLGGKNGGSRFKELDWYAASGVAGSLPSDFYEVGGSHGTSVASIICGQTQGWAPKSNIYSMPYAPLIYGGMPPNWPGQTTAFELILGWHRNKASDNPTIVNMSWGNFSQVLKSNGQVAPMGTQATPSGGVKADINCQMGIPASCNNDEWKMLYPDFPNTAENEIISELLDAGIVLVAACANNNFIYAKESSSLLYDFNFDDPDIQGPVYPCRGTFPAVGGGDDGCIAVSNISNNSELDGGKYFFKKNERCAFGDRIDMFAPGTNILAGVMGIGQIPFGEYAIPFPEKADGGLNQSFLSSVTGCSFSSPQVAGVLALWLQANRVPKNSQNRNMQRNARKWLEKNSIKNSIWEDTSTGTVGDCCGTAPLLNYDCSADQNPVVDSVSSYIMGDSENKFLFNGFSKESSLMGYET